MSDNIINALSSLKNEFTAIRHQLHEHPELGYKENDTSAFILAKLKEWGYTVETGFAGTGMVATLKNGNGKKTIGLRAEIDALPIIENSGVAWSSKTEGVSHMCGHDGHTTMLLCAAKHLAFTKNFNGTLHLIIQPAEELLTGGGVMVKDGLFEKYQFDMIFAQHNMPGWPSGHFYFRKGETMASSDSVKITVTGKGGHGAIPNKARDPMVACAQIILELQTIVSRNVDPFIPAVVTVGAMHVGTTHNVIPDEGVLLLTVRTMDNDTRKLVNDRIREIAEKCAESFHCSAVVEHQSGSPVLVNGDEATDFAYGVACEVIGKDKCHDDGVAYMGSEDFAFMLQAHPNGCYWIVGNGTSGCNGTPVHNPGYDFNDENIIPGAAVFVGLVEKYLQD